MPSLNSRINLCNQLATAILQTMTLTLVHKNISPENILIVSKEATAIDIGETSPGVFLIGWQYARQVERGVTNFRGETYLQRKIYQHPERQLVEAEKEYSMAHDLYSLEVCSMEILMWKSLLVKAEPPTMSEGFITAFESLCLQEDALEPHTKYASQIQRTLVCTCEQSIPVVAGDKVALLVRSFLTSLDEKEEGDDDAHYQAPLDNEARKQAVVHFVDTALKNLRELQSLL